MKPAVTIVAFAFLAATTACSQWTQQRPVPSNTNRPPYISLPMPQVTDPEGHSAPLCAQYDPQCVLS